VVIDTVKDVVIGDIGDEIMNTSGVAVRPFWWSKECLQVLGLASGDDSTNATTAGNTSGGTSSTTAGGSGGTSTAGGDGSNAGGEGADVKGGSGDGGESGGGLSGGWIALIAVLAAVAVAASVGFAFVLGRGRNVRSAGAGAATGATVQENRTATPFCSQCGQALAADAKFCAGCGRPV
jgi:hypothetical protein